jgi:hypothetical protein
MYRPKVYTASHLKHQAMWNTIRTEPDWDFIDWTATWPNCPFAAKELAGEHVPDEAYTNAWMEGVNEVLSSDFVLLYSGGEERLRGALVECGVALGVGIPVCAVGLPPDHSWRYHRQVKCFRSLREARYHLFKYTVAVPPNSRKRREIHD